MKRIGLLGGMSWESSIEYERMINEGVRASLGGVASADLLIRSYNFAEIEALQESGDWERAGALLAADAQRLEQGGAELVALCTNTMHVVAAEIEATLTVPFVHLADTTAQAVVAAGVDTVGLLGTRYTMEQDFYRGRLADAGLAVLIPDEPDRTAVHDIIYGELVQGTINEESRRRYLTVIEHLVERGARGVIAGCTEIELLVGADHVATAGADGGPLPYFPTTRLHAEAIVQAALSG